MRRLGKIPPAPLLQRGGNVCGGLTFLGSLGCSLGSRLWRDSGQKAWPFPFRISNCGFRILGFSFPIRIPQSTFRNSGARPVHEMETALWFLRPRLLPPGLARDGRPPFSRRHLSSTLSGSLTSAEDSTRIALFSSAPPAGGYRPAGKYWAAHSIFNSTSLP